MLVVAGLVVCTILAFTVPTALAQTGKKPAPSKSRDNDKDTREGPAPRLVKSKKSAVEGIGRYTSRNFIVNTDLSAEEAHELLGRLETMLGLISKYWGRPPSGVVEMYVAKDVRKWPPGALAPQGQAKIEEGAGITLGQTLTRGNAFVAKAVVYAIADHGTPQHEAVHAYCIQAFGRTGPVWYSEGMAEMGQYWKADTSSVNAHDIVIRYLQSAEPKSLNEIVNGVEFTGDSWQNYAWRWALCHLLANNPNYAPRFRPLGLGLLNNQDVSFEQTYGDMAKEITFEYRQFLKHIAQGYRADLCGWDWKFKFKPVRTSAVTTAKVDAGRGWQASRLTVARGEAYEFSVSGTWTTAKDAKATDAGGADNGTGRLIAAILADERGEYSLSDEFELGSFGVFIAPADGDLNLRCRDHWTAIADNKGTVSVKLKLKSKGNSLAPPKPEDEPKKSSN